LSHDTIDLSRRLADAAKAVDRFYHPDMYRLLETIHANTLLILQREKTMSQKIDDLNAGVSALTQTLAQTGQAITDEIAALRAALDQDDSTAIEQAIANLKTLNDQMVVANQQLAQSLPPPATPKTP
jgi:uncharacterized membrane protein YccC